jgi:glycerol-1-phosphate dehydrogenase [NAD(P)+]
MSCEGPATVTIAEGALVELGKIIRNYSNPLCVTDELIHSEYSAHLEHIIGQSCKWLMVNSYTSKSKKDFEGVDIIIGFGGGASLDVAKLIAGKTNLNWISVPTAASHDGIASEVASVSHDGYKYSQKCKGPLAVIADISIISRAPPRLKLAGLGDIICKTASLAEWRLAYEERKEPFDKHVYSVVESALDTVLRNDSIETLIQAEIDAGRAMSLFGSSRPCSGTEHAISHAMDRTSKELHGLQVAFATPICLYYLQETGYAEHGFEEILNYMRIRKMPTSFAEFGNTSTSFLDDVHHAVKIMRKRDRYSVLEHFHVEDSDLLGAMQELGY